MAIEITPFGAALPIEMGTSPYLYLAPSAAGGEAALDLVVHEATLACDVTWTDKVQRFYLFAVDLAEAEGGIPPEITFAVVPVSMSTPALIAVVNGAARSATGGGTTDKADTAYGCEQSKVVQKAMKASAHPTITADMFSGLMQMSDPLVGTFLQHLPATSPAGKARKWAVGGAAITASNEDGYTPLKADCKTGGTTPVTPGKTPGTDPPKVVPPVAATAKKKSSANVWLAVGSVLLVLGALAISSKKSRRA